MIQTSAEEGSLGEADDPARLASSWALRTGDELTPDLLAWELLGVGRRCELWLAWSVERWSPVAVKIPRRDVPGELARGALAREAEIAASLAHPSLVRLLEARVDGPALPHLVFEYVEGPTLATLLEEEGPLSPPDVIRLGLQVAAALHYLHGTGVVHLDVKPANIALREGRPILLDLDIALRVGQVRSETKPRGSAPYMAPEQVRCEPASPSMDLWALGAVLYEAATGVRPFTVADAGSDRVYPQLSERPAPLRAIDPVVPEPIERAVSCLLDIDPSSRPQRARDVLELLAAALPETEEGLWPGWVAIPDALPKA